MIQLPEEFIKEFDLLSHIARGGFGTVFKVVRRDT